MTTTTTHRPYAPSSSASAIAAELRRSGRGKTAARVDYLLGLDYDEPEQEPPSEASLRGLAGLLLHAPQLSKPRIFVGPDGLFEAEWLLPNDGVLSLEFLPSGDVRLDCVYEPTSKQVVLTPRSGTHSPARALAAVHLLLPLLTEQ